MYEKSQNWNKGAINRVFFKLFKPYINNYFSNQLILKQNFWLRKLFIIIIIIVNEISIDTKNEWLINLLICYLIGERKW
jgi:hypothetical protein